MCVGSTKEVGTLTVGDGMLVRISGILWSELDPELMAGGSTASDLLFIDRLQ